MNRRLRLGPPKQTFPQPPGPRLRPLSAPPALPPVTPPNPPPSGVMWPAGVDGVAVGGQCGAAGQEAGGLAVGGLGRAGRLARAARRIRLALVELAAIGRIGEPIAAVRMWHDVVRRVEPLA